MTPDLFLDDGNGRVQVVGLDDLDAHLDVLVRSATTAGLQRSVLITTAAFQLRVDIATEGITLTLDNNQGSATLSDGPLAHVEARAHIRSYARTGRRPTMPRETS